MHETIFLVRVRLHKVMLSRTRMNLNAHFTETKSVLCLAKYCTYINSLYVLHISVIQWSLMNMLAPTWF